MYSLVHTSRYRRSVQLAALFAFALMSTGRCSLAAKDVGSLVDEGLNQIVVDEVTGRMSKFLESYDIKGIAAVSIEGTFRSLTSEDLTKQMTSSLDRRGIAIDGTSNFKLDGTVQLTETEEAAVVVMECTLTDPNKGELCTVRVRKILPARSGS